MLLSSIQKILPSAPSKHTLFGLIAAILCRPLAHPPLQTPRTWSILIPVFGISSWACRITTTVCPMLFYTVSTIIFFFYFFGCARLGFFFIFGCAWLCSAPLCFEPTAILCRRLAHPPLKTPRTWSILVPVFDISSWACRITTTLCPMLFCTVSTIIFFSVGRARLCSAPLCFEPAAILCRPLAHPPVKKQRTWSILIPVLDISIWACRIINTVCPMIFYTVSTIFFFVGISLRCGF